MQRGRCAWTGQYVNHHSSHHHNSFPSSSHPIPFHSIPTIFLPHSYNLRLIILPYHLRHANASLYKSLGIQPRQKKKKEVQVACNRNVPHHPRMKCGGWDVVPRGTNIRRSECETNLERSSKAHRVSSSYKRHRYQTPIKPTKKTNARLPSIRWEEREKMLLQY